MAFFVVLQLFCILLQATAHKVYSFESVQPDEFSFLTLSPNPPVFLPDQFILCTSHIQTKLDGKRFIQIYGSDGSPWMSFNFFKDKFSVGLGGSFGTEWKYLAIIKEPKLYFWYHICHHVDTGNGLLSISINGKLIVSKVLVENLKKNKPNDLGSRLVLGKSTSSSWLKAVDHDDQFVGSLSNINVFVPSNLSVDFLSANLCSHQGDILSWHKSSWIQTGSGIQAMEKNNVCSVTGYYDIRLPIGLDQQQAVDTCNKLGHGRMKTMNSQEELKEYIKWFEKKAEGICSRFWTPFSDKVEEGLFASLEDGSKANFLPWAPGEPSGGVYENGVEFAVNQRDQSHSVHYNDQFSDAGIDSFICSACFLDRSFTLNLKGVCVHTFMGKLSNISKNYRHIIQCSRGSKGPYF